MPAYTLSSMKKVYIAIMIVASLVVTLGVVMYYRNDNQSLSDSEIRAMFACDRATKEARHTDKYCRDPDLYRKEADKY